MRKNKNARLYNNLVQKISHITDYSQIVSYAEDEEVLKLLQDNLLQDLANHKEPLVEQCAWDAWNDFVATRNLTVLLQNVGIIVEYLIGVREAPYKMRAW
jgi:hypothetical protein